MKIKLNVRVNLTKEGRLFTVWPKFHEFLPGLEFYTGHGSSTSEAALHRPFEIVHSNRIRIFNLS